MPDVEPFDQCFEVRPQFYRVRRAEPRHQAQQCHRLHAALTQILQRQHAETFAQRLALRTRQQRMMGKFRNTAAQRLHDLDLGGRVGHMVGAAHDMGHPHLGVVHNRCERVEDLPVAADQYRVADTGSIDGDVAQDTVAPLDPLLIQLEPPDPGTALGAQGILFGVGQLQRRPVIDRRAPHVQLLLALEVQFRRRLERLVEASHAAQLLCGFPVPVQPLGLALHPIPMQAEPVEITLDPVDVFFLGPFWIGVVDPQDEGPARFPRDHPVHQCGAQVAHVDPPCRGRRETGDDMIGGLVGHGSTPVAPEVSQGRVFVQRASRLQEFRTTPAQPDSHRKRGARKPDPSNIQVLCKV